MVCVDGNVWRPIKASHITRALRLAAAICFHTTGIAPADISACSLRARRAITLLCAHIDSNIIRLVGQWRSDEMLRYLHVQAYPLMGNLAQQMTTTGSFPLLPGQLIPPAANPLLNQVPL
jgi:hypothetical protein